MSKRNNFKEFISCPNKCGKMFKLGFKNKPKGMAQHLEHCKIVFPLPQKYKDILKVMKKKIGDNRDG